MFPLHTVGAGTFNSIEEMLKSDNQYIRGLAESMMQNKEQIDKIAADIFNKLPARTL